jgi:broad specificity phosphatase PhoE
MDSKAAEEVEGARTGKTITFIRHGESKYNEWAKNPMTWITLQRLKDPMIFDAALSEVGLQQVRDLASRGIGTSEPVELVVTSPLTRAIQTATGVFSPDEYKYVVSELHTEIMDTACDVGRVPSELKTDFPKLDFSQLPEIWWYHPDDTNDQRSGTRAIVKETRAMAQARVDKFREWLRQRPEKHIVVVGHSAFFKLFLNESSKLPNCGVRTFTLKN